MVRRVLVLTCLAYWAFLTVLLLTPDPAAVVGLKQVPVFPWGDVGIHFSFFTILAILVHAIRWPKRPDWPILVLLVYGIATESLQAFVPPRTVELMDYVENIAGVAFGSAVVWALWKWRIPLGAGRGNAGHSSRE
jgi:VanZ family protein